MKEKFLHDGGRFVKYKISYRSMLVEFPPRSTSRALLTWLLSAQGSIPLLTGEIGKNAAVTLPGISGKIVIMFAAFRLAQRFPGKVIGVYYGTTTPFHDLSGGQFAVTLGFECKDGKYLVILGYKDVTATFNETVDDPDYEMEDETEPEPYEYSIVWVKVAAPDNASVDVDRLADEAVEVLAEIM